MPKAGRGLKVVARDHGADTRSLRRIGRKLEASIGAEFFQVMARHLASALEADCVLVGEFVGGREERCRTVAAWMHGAPADFDYALAGSATAAVVLGKPVHCRSDAQSHFAADTLLSSARAEACVGVPLSGRAGHPIGVLMALFRRPVSSLADAKDLLGIFAGRASAELARKQEEDRLLESDQRYRAFIARNADAMWRIEFSSPIPLDLPAEEQLKRIFETGYIAECNDALARLNGAERAEQLVGRGLNELMLPSDPSVLEANLAAVRGGYKLSTVETTPVDAQGTRRHMLRSQWGIVEDGKLERIWGAHRDISDIRHVEMALDAAEQRMADLLEAMHLLVVILDPRGAIGFCNEYFYRLTGWRSGDLLGKDWLAAAVPADERLRVQAELERAALDPYGPVHFESTLLLPGGQRRQLAWDGTTLRGGDGALAGHALVGKDISELRLWEEKFRQAEKLASIGRLAGHVAHDFNNLLTVVLGYASVLMTQMKPSDAAYVGVSEIRKAAEEGAILSRRLLTFSRHQVLRPRVARLNTLVEEAGQMLGTIAGKGIELVLNLREEAGCVRADAAYFHQVLLNLATNSRDAMPEGGRIAIATANLDIAGPEPHATGLPPGPYAVLTFADNGCGMTEEVRGHLFEPFYTTKEAGRGTGLGLSTVYGIVKQSGGEILVESEPNRGTAFRIFLPRVEEEPAPPAAAEPALPRGTETILLVESRQDVRKLAGEVLGGLGYTVLEVEDLARAMEVNRTHPGEISLLLASVGASKAAGAELTDAVKAIHPQSRVLLISDTGDAASLSGSGLGYIQKPFTPAALARKVRETLDRD